ncbi:hypothetical protein TBK1r_60110 [Stieleria magnilauensis]|uniref:Uncharacterized protein n=1 Tax=Stieleria magnilauensis TaxID=2527963 RepID=A0ABX5XYS3_9BACT|nr:hypothetical protein TBK1r_59330 [Planctomycetes bacterium TBK1r]QDV86984.1 hypothetical protein TBK1r_60110 [Planctomycetes bacterium TBK1r]
MNADPEKVFEACAEFALSFNTAADPLGVFDTLADFFGRDKELRQSVAEVWIRRRNEFPFYCPVELLRRDFQQAGGTK